MDGVRLKKAAFTEPQLQGLEQFRGADGQGGSQSADVEKSDVALAAFYAAEVAPGQPAFQCECFLGQAGTPAELS
jgi:hypothetical protein